MSVDWKKPLEILFDDEWQTLTVLKILDDGYAAVLYENAQSFTGKEVAIFSHHAASIRNIPEPPKFVPWTMDELLHHWNSAFRKKGNPSYILRMNINNHYIGVGGVTLSLEQLKEYYEVTATPWDVTSWKPCGKME